jgi:hypothetical protein
VHLLRGFYGIQQNFRGSRSKQRRDLGSHLREGGFRTENPPAMVSKITNSGAMENAQK